ncbi:L,D-transpeptidase [Ligilactobacillus cholophilus]|uniref:L,D-transpeptidase n=1 Tax=Ligilactobacillus cholophilus TaxID=3050131 RepID=UPI0025AFEDCE|nr:L,D-transpeptidase [Ligilactobacillus cholophilus]
MEKRSERIKRQREQKWKKLHIRKFDFILLPSVLLALLSYHQLEHVANAYEVKQKSTISKKENQHVKTVASKASTQSASSQAQSSSKQTTVMHTPIDWQKPSENRPYPDLAQVKDFWVKVSLKKNRTYLMSGKKVIYTMYSSGGVFHKDKQGKEVSDTPTGTFYIQNERGNSFFNGELNEGANYWVSWKDHGVYLFHSVPTMKDGQYNIAEAEKLGKEPASHGCIRLSVPDAKWMMENLKVGTKVVIKNK